MGKHTKAYLSLGSNQGERTAHLKKARQLLADTAGLILKSSKIYETAAWGKTDQGDFLNQVILLDTTLSAEALIKTCLKIEAALGRSRGERWGARSIDIDILFYGSAIIDQAHLQIPHPRIQDRNFVLVPLAELAPTFIHPVYQKNIATLLQNCEDGLQVVAQA